MTSRSPLARGREVAAALLFALALDTACGPGAADFSAQLGGGYEYVSAGPLQKIITGTRGIAVGNVVVDYAHDDLFVLALRLVAVAYECDPGPHLTEVITSSVQYWVIDKQNADVSGPFNRETFDQARIRIGVPDELKLDEAGLDRFLERARESGREELVRSSGCRRLGGALSE